MLAETIRRAAAAQAKQSLSFPCAGALRLFLRVARHRVRLVRVHAFGAWGSLPTTPTAVLRALAGLDAETRTRAYYLPKRRLLVVYMGN